MLTLFQGSWDNQVSPHFPQTLPHSLPLLPPISTLPHRAGSNGGTTVCTHPPVTLVAEAAPLTCHTDQRQGIYVYSTSTYNTLFISTEYNVSKTSDNERVHLEDSLFYVTITLPALHYTVIFYTILTLKTS